MSLVLHLAMIACAKSRKLGENFTVLCKIKNPANSVICVVSPAGFEPATY